MPTTYCFIFLATVDSTAWKGW